MVWQETFNADVKSIPTTIEGQVLQNFLDENAKLPRWNVGFLSCTKIKFINSLTFLVGLFSIKRLTQTLKRGFVFEV